MSRKVSQSNISAYFGQPAELDFEAKRNAHSLPLPFSPQKYKFCLIAVCLRGCADFTFSSVHYQLCAGELLCIMPGSFVCLESISDDLLVSYGVIKPGFLTDITSRFPNVMFDYLSKYPNVPMTSRAIDEAIRYFDLIDLKMAEKYNLFQKDIIFNILYSFMLDIYNLINKNMSDTALPFGKTAVESIFDKFTALTMRHLRENQSIAFYAELLNITPKHLNRVVKKIKGVSVKQWLDSYMLQELKLELLYTSKSLKEISMDFSFSSGDAMHHFFKKHTDMSPSEFRAQGCCIVSEKR